MESLEILAQSLIRTIFQCQVTTPTTGTLLQPITMCFSVPFVSARPLPLHPRSHLTSSMFLICVSLAPPLSTCIFTTVAVIVLLTT